jgi:hypothetical protein
VELLNNDRLSHWFFGTLVSWTVFFLIFGVPIFHIWLGFSMAKIAIAVGVCCGMQLAVTPWLYSARITTQNPDGLVRRRAAAVTVWFSLTMLLLFYLVQRGWPHNPAARQARIVMFASLIAFFVAEGVLLRYRSRSIALRFRLLRDRKRP